MSKLVIRGGQRLSGAIDVAGSKNIALAVLSGVVLTEGEVRLRNVPRVSDTRTKVELLRTFGARADWSTDELIIDCSDIRPGDADESMVRSIRTSFYMLGPLLARIGEVVLPAPGGCKIGARPVDYHVKGLTMLGARIDLEAGVYRAKANRLVGSEIYLDKPSAGATQHIMSTAVLAEGITTIQNAAMEPEIIALADFLNRLGANVEGAGTSTISITGRRQLSAVDFRIPADRIQAGTFLLAGVITQGDVTVRGILPEDQTALANKLREAGAIITDGPDWMRAEAPNRLKGIRITTMPHPGFPTDIQQPMAACLCLARGNSVVEETIYESRIGHVQELARMGADIKTSGQSVLIDGVEKLRGATVEASDLRAGAALCLAGLVADGETIVKNVHWIDRGYESIETSLNSLGANVVRSGSDREAVKVL